MEPDQPQAQVPVAVEGDREPQGQLMISTSGAAYELETSGDGEARQMAASNDDTADLFGSPLEGQGAGFEAPSKGFKSYLKRSSSALCGGVAHSPSNSLSAL